MVVPFEGLRIMHGHGAPFEEILLVMHGGPFEGSFLRVIKIGGRWLC